MKTYRKKNRIHFIGALVSVFLSNLFAVVLQFFKGNVLDFAVAGELQTTVQYALLLIAFILCEVLCYFCCQRFCARFVTGCTKALKQDIFAAILRQDYVSFKTRTQGEYIAKYTNEADTIKARYFTLLPVFWEILSKIIFVSVALFLLDWRLAIVTIALLTTPLYIPKLIEKRLQNAQAACLQAVEENLAKVNDWLAGFEIIKNYAIEKQVLARFRTVNHTTMDKLLRDARLSAVAQLITTLISYLSWFIVLVCATWLVLAGEFSAGDFFVAIGMIDQLSYPLISLAGITRQLISIRPACKTMAAFLKDDGQTGESHLLRGLGSEIRFSEVCFAYEDQRPILENFNLTIQKGKRYLFRGPSGCGKTTTVNLLLRYFEVTGGTITIDGLPLSHFGSTYGCMTVVRQEATLFHDTLRNNLTMYQDIPESRLIAVLSSVGLGRFAVPQALDTIITESGANLSGGEKKRVCLARALLRDTDVLILDEPLANLDAETAERIEDLLLSIRDKTIIIVSHQFTEGKLDRFQQVIDFTKTS